MSKTTKRKYIIQDIQDLSLPTESQCIVKILKSCGNNLHEVINPVGEQYLVSMPTKFRRNIWVKMGDYVVSEPIKEGNKVKGEIVKILTKDHVECYRAQNCWPHEFDEDRKKSGHLIKEDNNDTNQNEELFVNTNRLPDSQKIVNSNSDSSSVYNIYV